ncbi:hypothetical protein LCGC14_0224940 [marine sediment metagenome]|uniref:Uncharacterized protein n=1 Tax=marine sediment metagenome TaxID=412755 RepID=A0A0F9UCK7_9ZZZZ
MYECLKCNNRFEKPHKTNLYLNGATKTYIICPTCSSQMIIEVLCAKCDSYKKRGTPCEEGNTTIVPFNVSCDKWTPRTKNKPKVI